MKHGLFTRDRGQGWRTATAVLAGCITFLLLAFAAQNQQAYSEPLGPEDQLAIEKDSDQDGILDVLEPDLPAKTTVEADLAAKDAPPTGGSPRDDGWLLSVEWRLDSCDSFDVDEATGACQWVGVTGFHGLNSAARDRYGRIYSVENDIYHRNGNLVMIDPETGAGTFVAALDFGDETPDVRALAFSLDDRLFAAQNATPNRIDRDFLYELDRETGVGTMVGATGLWSLQGLAFSPDGVLYGWDLDQGLVTLDTVTGAATDVETTVASGAMIQSITFCPDGRLFGISDALWQVFPEDGTVVRVGTESYGDLRGVEFVLPYLPLDVDIEPYGLPGKVNPGSSRKIHVAVLGNEVMAAWEIDAASLRFGPWEAAPAHDLSDQAVLLGHYADVNGDQRSDLIAHFYTQETGLTCDDYTGVVTGQLRTGKPIRGEANFVVQGCD